MEQCPELRKFDLQDIRICPATKRMAVRLTPAAAALQPAVRRGLRLRKENPARPVPGRTGNAACEAAGIWKHN